MRALAGPALAALFGCGSLVSGDVGGHAFSASYAISRDSVVMEPREIHHVTVLLGGVETSDLCRDFENQSFEKDTTYLRLEFGLHGALEPGEFAIGGEPVTDPRFARAIAKKLDGTCGDALNRRATGGTITLDSVSGSGLGGEFSLAFGDDTLEGTFSTDTCGAVTLQPKICR